MALRHSPLLRIMLVVLLCALLLAAVGCSDDKPEATEQQEAPAEEGEHNVAPANSAQDAVDELNENIEDSTSNDP